MPRSPLDYFVLDAISFDAEQLDNIVTFLNQSDSEWQSRFERPVQRPEVLAAVMRLVRDGFVEVTVPDPAGGEPQECGQGVWPARPISDMYFDLTGRGRVRYLNWDS